jgi:hypothetical protein
MKQLPMISIERIDQLIVKGKEVINTHRPQEGGWGFPTLDSQAFASWQTQVINYLRSNLPVDNQYLISFTENVKDGYRSSVEKGVGILESVKEDVNLGLLTTFGSEKFNPINPLIKIFSKFHEISRQLRHRYNDRETLNITDEYDVQDLLHALLRLDFEDIRPEEWSPSYAGKSSRMDFLLKDFKIVIEVKKTRSGLGAKELGGQLIEDIARYKTHPDCETLLCFVYDPEGLIGNPRGIENDLSQEDGPIRVRVFIKP